MQTILESDDYNETYGALAQLLKRKELEPKIRQVIARPMFHRVAGNLLVWLEFVKKQRARESKTQAKASQPKTSKRASTKRKKRVNH